MDGKVTRVRRALVVWNVRKITVLAIMASVCASPAGAGQHATSVCVSLHVASTVVAWMASASVKMAGVETLVLDICATRHVPRMDDASTTHVYAKMVGEAKTAHSAPVLVTAATTAPAKATGNAHARGISLAKIALCATPLNILARTATSCVVRMTAPGTGYARKGAVTAQQNTLARLARSKAALCSATNEGYARMQRVNANLGSSVLHASLATTGHAQISAAAMANATSLLANALASLDTPGRDALCLCASSAALAMVNALTTLANAKRVSLERVVRPACVHSTVLETACVLEADAFANPTGLALLAKSKFARRNAPTTARAMTEFAHATMNGQGSIAAKR